MVNCFPRKFDRTVFHFVGAQIKSVISVLTRLHEPLLVPDRDIVIMTESAHTESCLYRPSINVFANATAGTDLCDRRSMIGHFRPRDSTTPYYSRRHDLANAAIAASRVGSYPWAARRMWPLWPLAHIHGRSCGAIGTLKMRPTMMPLSGRS